MKCAALLLALAVTSAYAQSPAAEPPPHPTLTLTPSVVMAKLKPGEGWTHTLRMTNGTSSAFYFDIEVRDVVVKDGKRTYVRAGETEASIAATAVATPRSVTVPPQGEGSTTVTLTVPQQTTIRAVVIYFKGRMDASKDSKAVGLAASLGSLVTFELSDDYAIKAEAFSTTPQTDTANQVISHELFNSGSEVVVPQGATVIIDDSGRSAAKATFPAQRLLPGERLTYSATSPLQLKPGHYRAISSFEFGSHVVTASGEFSVQ